MRNTLQHLVDVLFTPFGFALHIWPAPSRGPTWFACERWRDPDALLLWCGPVHMVIDRGH